MKRTKTTYQQNIEKRNSSFRYSPFIAFRIAVANKCAKQTRVDMLTNEKQRSFGVFKCGGMLHQQLPQTIKKLQKHRRSLAVFVICHIFVMSMPFTKFVTDFLYTYQQNDY